MTGVKYTIWHDADYDLAYWVCRNSVLREKDVMIRALPKSTRVPDMDKAIVNDADGILLPLIKYEHPDIVITSIGGDGAARALAVGEFMTHTPQWQHPAQRFARIYGAANAGVPSFLIVPAKKAKLERKENEYRDVTYKLSKSVKYLFGITEKLTKTVAAIFEWPDVGGYLRLDQKSPTAPFVDGRMAEWFESINECIEGNPAPKAGPALGAYRPTIEDYPTLCGIQSTNDFLVKHGIELKSVPELNSRVLVFAPNGLSPQSSYFRTDPYAGMLCAFDNMFCRDHNTGNRKCGLALVAKCVSLDILQSRGMFFNIQDHDEKSCPFESFRSSKKYIMEHINRGCPYTGSKQQRIYGQIADLIVFDDGAYCHGSVI